jgi:uncharacterized membrane protein YphA (DoxX/SURF4 family)
MGPQAFPSPCPDTPAADVFTAPAGPRPRWTFAERALFRFAFFYLILYCLPFPFQPLVTLIARVPLVFVEEHPAPEVTTFLSEWVFTPYQDGMDKAVLWTGDKVFGVEIQYRPAGSGDTTWNYVEVFLQAVTAAALAVLWTLAATLRWVAFRREQPAYPVLHEWLRVYVRFYVAYQMVIYGLMKVIKLQFPYPSTDALLHTYGESSPMHLLWTFMGASEGYTVFAGAGELLAGLLLCTRRSTLLGALVTFGVMTHVAALNYCYDVPVKLFSTHLVLMSVFLMAPDLPWLTRALVFGRRTVSRAVAPLTPWAWLNWALLGVRTLLVLTFLGVTVHGNYKMRKEVGDLAPKPPMYGLWEVDEFAVDDKVLPPLTTDAVRWQRVVFTKKGFRGSPMFGITNMRNKPVMYYSVEVDLAAKTITLSRPGGPPGSDKPPTRHVLRYTEPEPDVMDVAGELEMYANGSYGKKQIRARLRHTPEEKFLLYGRGYHWINEMPYNQYGSRHEPPPKIMPPPKRP